MNITHNNTMLHIVQHKSSYKPNIGLSCFRTLSTSLRLTTIKSSPQLSGKSMMDFPLFRTAFLMAFFTFGKVGSMLKR